MRTKLKITEGIFPMPVLMVATYNEDGSVNVMNAAWGTMQERGTVALNLTESHKTVKNIKARGAFTVSIADAAHVVEADYFGVETGNKVPDKFARSGLTASKAETVDAPVINEFPLCLECKFIEYQTNEYGCGVIGKVFNSHGCKRAYTMRTVVQGTKGTLIFDNTNPWISVFKEELRGDDMFLNTRQQTVEMRVQLSLNNHNVEGEIADFCRCITEGKPVTTDGVEGASTVAVGLAIVESVEKGLPVKVDYEF